MNDEYQARLVTGGTQVGEESHEFSLRPKSFDELVGQTKLVDNLKVYVKAALERGEALTIPFAGPPGLGKTTIAHLLANELGVDLHVTSGPAIERKDLAGILSHLKERDVLFIDEIHRLSPVVEENLIRSWRTLSSISFSAVDPMHAASKCHCLGSIGRRDNALGAFDRADARPLRDRRPNGILFAGGADSGCEAVGKHHRCQLQ